ncbi:hypothetical protein LTR66_017738, partial [Elasticomyces elasticus]
MVNVKPIELDGSTLEGGGQLVRVALSLSAITGIPIHLYNIRANRSRQGLRQKGAGSPRAGHDGRGGQQGSSKQRRSTTSGVGEGGLKESHLAALIYLTCYCDAYVEGAEVGSSEVTFIPGAGGSVSSSKSSNSRKKESTVKFDTNTIELQNPGSVWLIFQALYPFLVFGNHKEDFFNKQNDHGEYYTELTFRGGTNVSKAMSSEYLQQVFLPICAKIGLPKTEVKVVERGWAGAASRIGEIK